MKSKQLPPLSLNRNTLDEKITNKKINFEKFKEQDRNNKMNNEKEEYKNNIENNENDGNCENTENIDNYNNSTNKSKFELDFYLDSLINSVLDDDKLSQIIHKNSFILDILIDQGIFILKMILNKLIQDLMNANQNDLNSNRNNKFELTIGIIGCGNVGSKLLRNLVEIKNEYENKHSDCIIKINCSSRNFESLSFLKNELLGEVDLFFDNELIFSSSNIIFLCTQIHQTDFVLKECSLSLKSRIKNNNYKYFTALKEKENNSIINKENLVLDPLIISFVNGLTENKISQLLDENLMVFKTCYQGLETLDNKSKKLININDNNNNNNEVKVSYDINSDNEYKYNRNFNNLTFDYKNASFHNLFYLVSDSDIHECDSDKDKIDEISNVYYYENKLLIEKLVLYFDSICFNNFNINSISNMNSNGNFGTINNMTLTNRKSVKNSENNKDKLKDYVETYYNFIDKDEINSLFT